MGGINHQPCNNYLSDSVSLSRAITLSRSYFCLANVSLEDILLEEMEKRQGSMPSVVAHLNTSVESLNHALKCISSLEERMETLQFVDLSVLQSTDLLNVGASLAEDGVVDWNSWVGISKMMKEKGFKVVLADIRDGVDKLISLTVNLSQHFNELEDLAEVESVTAILEMNGVGNIKRPFGKLFTAWNSFELNFLSSSLISTELWYLSQDKDSLTCDKTSHLVV